MGRPVWICIGIGFIGGFGGGFLGFFSWSKCGGFIICWALISEIFHTKPYRNVIDKPWSIDPVAYVSVPILDKDTNIETNIWHVMVDAYKVYNHPENGYPLVPEKDWTLGLVRNADESNLTHSLLRRLPPEYANYLHFDARKTAERVVRITDIAIAMTAVIGTFFWAFGKV